MLKIIVKGSKDRRPSIGLGDSSPKIIVRIAKSFGPHKKSPSNNHSSANISTPLTSTSTVSDVPVPQHHPLVITKVF